MSRIGWYVHHHGAGHLTRFLAIRPRLQHDVVVFSSLPSPTVLPPRTTWVVLPRDDDDIVADDGSSHSPADADPTVRGLLHWAPIGHRGHAERLARIAAELAAHPSAAFLVDVSVEVALFVRLLGVRVVVVTQPGDRNDAPHSLAYRMVDRILAPWAPGMHPGSAPEAPVEPSSASAGRVVQVGGISRFDGRKREHAPVAGSVLVLGGGGERGLADRVDAAAAATPGTTWELIGGDAGWVSDPWMHLQRAEVIVSAAGQNSIADLAAVDARAVVIPMQRPFDEQVATANQLDARGLAVVAAEWPDARLWPELLRQARELTPSWSVWGVAGATGRAAAVIDEVAVGRP